VTRFSKHYVLMAVVGPVAASVVGLAPASVSACGTSIDGQCVIDPPPPMYVTSTADAVPVYTGNAVTVAVKTTQSLLKSTQGTVQAGLEPIEAGSPLNYTVTVPGMTSDCGCLTIGNGGDACMIYTCNSNAKNWWFVVGNYNANNSTNPAVAVNGSVSGAVLQPISPPNDGHFYMSGLAFQEIQTPDGNPHGTHLCSVWSGIGAQPSWTYTTYAPRFDPSGDTYQSSSNPSFQVGGGLGPISASYTFGADAGYHLEGGWDSQYNNYGSSMAYEGSWPNNTCPSSPLAEAGGVDFDWDLSNPAGDPMYITFTLGWQFTADNVN